MAIEVVSAGDELLAAWGEEVADALNELQKLSMAMMTADESTNSATPSDITGLSFPVVNGRAYVFRIVGGYSVAQTNQGLGFGFRHPGGTAVMVCRIFGPTNASVETIERIIETVANTDELTTQASSNAAGTSPYHVEATVHYTCSADGTFQFRKARNGTSGSTGLTLEAPWSVLAHSSAIS